MGNKKSNRQFAPGVTPVERIELSEKNTKLRIVLVAVLVVIAAVSIGAGVMGLFTKAPGWQKVEVSTQLPNCGRDFVLHYDFGKGELSAAAETKQLTALYTDAAVKAWQLFSSQEAEQGNLASVNAAVNAAVEVDPAVYEALALADNSRYLFLPTVYLAYSQMFQFADSREAAQYDPAQNPEEMAFVKEVVAFANDPEAVSLELLGDNQVKLHVSESYLVFARENEITQFVALGWLENAFIADYLAEQLMENGFTNGYLASYDGFTRNLCTRGESYSVNFFDRQESGIYTPARMDYSGPMSLVFLRDYPLSEADSGNYYTFPSGRIATRLIDPADGVDKSAVHEILGYSRETGCAGIALSLAPVFLADSLEETALQALAEQGIWAIWPAGTELRYNEAELKLTLLPDGGMSYTKALMES